MHDRKSTLCKLVRTSAVLLGGIVLSVLVPAFLILIIQPDAARWIARAFTVPANSPEWNQIGPHVLREAAIAAYLVAPLAGLAVGLFVGLFQKIRPTIIAASCLVPGFLYELRSDHARLWMHSGQGVLRYGATQSLPFIAAILAAAICNRLIRNRETEAGNQTLTTGH